MNHLAPEWARQDAVLIVWPHTRSDWAILQDRNLLNEIQNTYINISRYISHHQKLIIIAYDAIHIEQIENSFINTDVDQDNIDFVDIPTNGTWVRDYGPISVYSDDNKIFLYEFDFDAWGKKYTHDKDKLFNQQLSKKLNFNANFKKIDFVLEAGNIEVNNKGALLTSSSCFKRSSSIHLYNSEYLEEKFLIWFGIEKTYWISNVKLHGDDTDGHVDTLTRFSADNVIVYSSVNHHSDPNANALNLLHDQLITIKKQNNNDLELVPLPLPDPIYNANHHQLPASYVNFLITNKYILTPVFNDPQDNYTLKLLDDCFPKHEIIDIESRALIKQFGGIHCATMQIPEGLLL